MANEVGIEAVDADDVFQLAALEKPKPPCGGFASSRRSGRGD